MSQFHTFLFEGLPVRGAIVRLDEAWQQVQSRRASNSETGAYAPPVRELLGITDAQVERVRELVLSHLSGKS